MCFSLGYGSVLEVWVLEDSLNLLLECWMLCWELLCFLASTAWGGEILEIRKCIQILGKKKPVFLGYYEFT